MKTLFFALPLCILLANCSSSRKTTTPPAGPGISNVNVSANGAAPTAVNTSATATADTRDWAYSAKHDETLNGNWALQGMLASNGTWTSTVQDTAAAVASTSASTDVQGTGSTGSVGSAGSSATTDNSMATTTDASTGSTAAVGAKTKTKTKVNNKAIYDSAKARLSYQVQSTPSIIDSSLLQPFKYWGRTPSMAINTATGVFSGSTGCNSMSGSFHFSGNDIKFSNAIHTSKMNCNDYDEAGFLSALKKVDSYAVNGNELQLKQGSTVLLTFAKK